MYKKVNVVMLTTNKKATKGEIFIDSENQLDISCMNIGCRFNSQHLYITSDEEIKEGDWYIFNVGYACGIKKAYLDDIKDIDLEINPKKIIATTDTSLRLPLIPQQFIQYYIEEYNKGNVITKVEVEWEEFIVDDYRIFYEDPTTDETLKINPDNTINIKSIKDSWSREEVIKIPDILFEKYFNDYFLELFNKNLKSKHLPFSKSNTFKKWIEENL